MKILCLGDPHFSINNLEMLNNCYFEIVELVRSEKVQKIVSLGDTIDDIDNKGRVDLIVLKKACEFYINLSEHVEKIIVLIGNHDRLNNNVDIDTITNPELNVHPFIGLNHPKIKIVDTTWYDDSDHFVYVPYVKPGLFEKALELNKPLWEPRLGFAHQEFHGVKMGAVISNSNDRSKDLYLINGHIHEHQVLGKIYHPGTFYQQTYAETPDKAVVILDIEDNFNWRPQDFNFITRIRLKSIHKKIQFKIPFDKLNEFVKPDDPYTKIKIKVIVPDTSTKKSVQFRDDYARLKNVVDKIEIVVDTATKIPTRPQQTIMNPDYQKVSVYNNVLTKISGDQLLLKLFQDTQNFISN